MILNQTEKDALIDIIDGTLDSIEDFEVNRADVTMWISLLSKLDASPIMIAGWNEQLNG